MRSGAVSRFSNATATVLRPVADGVLSILLAPVCAACRLPLQSPTLGIVCTACWDAVRPITPPFCPVCSDPLTSWRVSLERCAECRLKRPHIAAGRTVGAYDGPLRSILQAFKYDRRRSLAAPLGRLMRRGGAAVLADADCVVPVPLHWRRRWRRGFNQARELAHHLGLPVRCALRRSQNTRTQTDLPADARFRNVRNAFVAVRGCPVSFGEFTACTNYPNCKYVKQKSTGVLCPKDGGDIVERKSRRGRCSSAARTILIAISRCGIVRWRTNVALRRAIPRREDHEEARPAAGVQ